MSPAQKQILYVGPEADLDSRLRVELERINPEWTLLFSPNGRDALTQLEQGRFDAVVADEILPDMDGFKLLDTVQRHRPEARCLIVSELNDPRAALKCAGVAHQCVPKPWDVQTLGNMLERAFALGIWLSNPAVRSLVRRMTIVPSPPDLYFEVVRALRSAEPDLDRVAIRASQDPAMTAKLLQLANSVALGLRHTVTSVLEAISFLGLETTRSLILLAHTFSYCDASRTAGFSIDRLWRHSLTTASLARRIAREEGVSAEEADECFLAGLLHDLGELLLAANLPLEYAAVLTQAKQAQLPAWQFESQKFGANHAEAGAELMAIWNLPLPVVEAIALHHHPAKMLSTSFCPLAAVHVADAIEHQHAAGESADDKAESLWPIDENYLEDLGVAGRLETWREACLGELNNTARRADL